MARTPEQNYNELQPLILQQINRSNQKRDDAGQYKPTSIPVHTHNNIDSPPVNYRNLANVRNYLTSSTITLTVAQVRTLHSVPVVLVPPPQNAHTVIIVHSVTARLTYGGTPYVGTHDLEFHYTDGNGIQVTDSMPASFLDSTSSAFYHAPAVAASFAPVAGGSGKNGQIVAFVNTTDPTTGNSTITFVTHYHIVTFAT